MEGKKEPKSSQGKVQTKVKQKSGKAKYIACCCGAALMFLLVFGGLVGLVFFTDVEIPVLSDIISSVEDKFRDPVKEAETVNQKAVSTAIGVVYPMLMENKTMAELLQDSEFNEEKMMEMIEEYEEFKSMRVKLESDIYSKSTFENRKWESPEFNELDGAEIMQSNEMIMDYEMTLSGAYNFKDSENGLMDMTLDVKVEDDGVTFPVMGQARIVGDKVYFKIVKMPDAANEFIDVSQIKDQWIVITKEDFENGAEGLEGLEGFDPSVIGQEYENLMDEQDFDTEEFEKFLEFITDETVTSYAELAEDENIEGNDCDCIKYDLDSEEVLDIMKRGYEIFEEEYEDEDLEESVDGIETLVITACVGEDTNRLHKLAFSVKDKSESEFYNNEIEMDLEMRMWDYNADIEVEEPVDALSWDEAYELVDMPYVEKSKDMEVRSELMKIELRVSSYYADNMEYPSSLDQLDIEKTEFYGEKVKYVSDGDSYELSIVLPSGEEYSVGYDPDDPDKYNNYDW